MPKVRISHFTTKGIEITSSVSTTVRKHTDSLSTVHQPTIKGNQAEKGTTSRLTIYKVESRYAGTPVAVTSELIDAEIRKETKRFRKVNEKKCLH